MPNMMLKRLPGICTDVTLPERRRDKFLVGSNNGVLFLNDVAYDWCWSGGNPVNGSVLKDIAERGADGSVVTAGAGSIDFIGGGFDFSNVSQQGNYCTIPASVAAALWGGGTGPQEFLVFAYVKLPISGEWGSSSATIVPFLNFGQYTTGPDIATIGTLNVDRNVTFRRQTAVGTAVAMNIVVPSTDYGLLAQLAFWRNAAGEGATIRTATGRLNNSIAKAANNTADFSAQIGHVGVSTRWYTGGVATGRGNWRAFRWGVENLAVSGRDPLTVLEADWVRNAPRFSVA